MARPENPTPTAEIDQIQTEAQKRAMEACTKELQSQREDVLQRSAKRGHIAFWLRTDKTRQKPNERRIFVFDPDQEGKIFYFATAAADVPISDIETPDKPFDILINVRKNRSVHDVGDVGRSVNEFLQEFFPEIFGTSFSFYSSPQAYREERPIFHFSPASQIVRNIREARTHRKRSKV